jgi:putative DNA primase/helicase
MSNTTSAAEQRRVDVGRIRARARKLGYAKIYGRNDRRVLCDRDGNKTSGTLSELNAEMDRKEAELAASQPQPKTRSGYDPDAAFAKMADAWREEKRRDQQGKNNGHAKRKTKATGNGDAGNGEESGTAFDKLKEEVQRLAALPPLQYELERNKVAEELGIRTSVLDDAVQDARPQRPEGAKAGQGRPFTIADIEPWSSEVDGAELLDEIVAAIKVYLVMPNYGAHAAALWAMHTHCLNCFSHSPRVAITSPEPNCGKTTLLDVLKKLSRRPMPTDNVTVSSLFRMVELVSPTVLIDEADTYLKENDELRGILNSGHKRGGQVIRTVGDDHEPRQFATWAPAAIAMIGKLPATLHSRSINIHMRRATEAEQGKVRCFREERAGELDLLARKMARWAHDHEATLAAADPDMSKLMNRTADNWRPLFAIADEAGGHWPQLVRGAAEEARKVAEESISALLLHDIRWIFDGRPEPNEDGKIILRDIAAVDRVTSAIMVARLAEIDGRPWGEWGRSGKPMTPGGLAKQLDKFGIGPKNIRFGSGVSSTIQKGYMREDFEDTFERYLSSETNAQPEDVNDDGFDHNDLSGTLSPFFQDDFSNATPLQSGQIYNLAEKKAATGGGPVALQAATCSVYEDNVAAKKSPNPLKNNKCSGVAAETPQKEGRERMDIE